MSSAATRHPERLAAVCAAATLALVLLPGCGSTDAVPDPLDLPAGMDLVLRSPRFELHTDYPAEDAAHHQQVLQGLCDWFDGHIFPVPWQRPLRVLLFDDHQRWEAWNKARGLEVAFGRYIDEWNVIALDLRSGLGTAFHELTHCFLHRTCAHPRTVFVEEGAASFFEKFIGNIDEQGHVELTVGYFSSWRFMHAKAFHHDIDIAQQWTADREHFDDSCARSFMVFLHHHGWFVPFVRALRSATGDGRQELEAAAGRTLAQLDQEWHAWVDAQELVVTGDVFLVDKSFVASTAEWEKWLADNEQRLRFDEELGIWRVRR